MALDHYISQVHLRNFYSPAMGRRKMYAIRKSNFKCFPPRSEDVCRIENGSTNDYLLNSRIVEEFMKQVEPYYNDSVNKFRIGEIDNDSIFVIAGFIAYILSCSPTAMRIGADPLQHMAEATAVLVDSEGEIPPPPKELGGASLTQLLRDKIANIKIDEKYPQALAISGILHRTVTFGNFDWDILINEELSSPFFTSDFPVVIERSKDPRIINRIVPLAPDIAIRIRPSLEEDRRNGNLNFQYFSSRTCRLKRREVLEINKLVVRCAEDLVFFRDNHKWVEPFVQKNSGFWIEPITEKFPTANGVLQLSTMRIARRAA